MRLVITIPSLSGGGAERVMLNIARALSEKGHDVTVAVREADGPYDVPEGVKLKALGVHIGTGMRLTAKLPRRRTIVAPVVLAYQIVYMLRLAWFLKRHKPDAVLSALFMQNLTTIMSHRLARSRARLVVSERNTLSLNVRKYGRLKYNAFRRMIRWLYPQADAVTAVSGGVAEDLSRSTGIARGIIRVINNPTVTPEIPRLADEEPDCPWLSDDVALADSFINVIVACGRLSEQKDYPTLLRALAILNRDEPKARLVILGTGKHGDLEDLRALAERLRIAHLVRFEGFVANPYAYMQRADVFVLSSRWEGFPNVLLEAMACGAPVVSTDCPHGPRDILDDGRYGRLVPVGDAAAMARAMADELEGCAPHCGVCPGDGAERAGEFTMERILPQYEAVLIGSHTAPRTASRSG